MDEEVSLYPLHKRGYRGFILCEKSGAKNQNDSCRGQA